MDIKVEIPSEQKWTDRSQNICHKCGVTGHYASQFCGKNPKEQVDLVLPQGKETGKDV